MLSGVGGRTIEEAWQNITHAEFISWCQYRAKWGPLNVGLRVDRAVAQAMRLYFNANTKGTKYRFPDFSPYDEAARKVDVQSPESVFAFLKGMSNGKPRNTDT